MHNNLGFLFFIFQDTGGQVSANTPMPVVEIETRSTSKGQETDTSREDVVQSSPLVSYKVL